MQTFLIESFISTNYGYGNPFGRFWFIGMEEGGSNTKEEAIRRFEVWQQLGESETSDLVEYHKQLGLMQFFREPVKLQLTWGFLIRIILSSKGISIDNKAVKNYQRDHLGRKEDETCLLELLPLSSPSLGVWHYSEWKGIPYLNSRKEYRKIVLPRRIDGLKNMIKRYNPPVVVFYGTTYRSSFEQIVGSPFLKNSEGLEWFTDSKTQYFMIKHPAARGSAKTAYFEYVGQKIANFL